MTARHAHGGPDCRALLERLSEYLDGELDLAACDKIREHMEDCPRCEAFLESLRRTVEHIRRLPPAEISPTLRREIVAAWERLKEASGH